jgi:hypothetical protein
MILLHDNFVFYDGVDIFSLSELPGNTFDEALIDRRLARQGITVDDENQYLQFDLLTAKTVKYFAMMNTNITATATVTVHGNDTDDFTSPEVSFTPDKYGNDFISEIDEEYRYWRIEIDDVGNPDDKIKIGLVYLGGAIVCPGMEPGMNIPRVSNSVTQKSVTGQVFADRRIQFRKFGVSFIDIEHDEKLLLDDVWLKNDVTVPLIVLIWENDLDVELPMYSTLTKGFEWSRSQSDGLLWRLSLEFEECF